MPSLHDHTDADAVIEYANAIHQYGDNDYNNILLELAVRLGKRLTRAQLQALFDSHSAMAE